MLDTIEWNRGSLWLVDYWWEMPLGAV